ncbi:hypothetical protein BV20DRAFT_156057 [Pilatotrama ljubarskyi]|nr:hypothetical protein BV20DRAFT_156057 [Pilatotrama ljubarskyi]
MGQLASGSLSVKASVAGRDARGRKEGRLRGGVEAWDGTEACVVIRRGGELNPAQAPTAPGLSLVEHSLLSDAPTQAPIPPPAFTLSLPSSALPVRSVVLPGPQPPRNSSCVSQPSSAASLLEVPLFAASHRPGYSWLLLHRPRPSSNFRSLPGGTRLLRIMRQVGRGLLNHRFRQNQPDNRRTPDHVHTFARGPIEFRQARCAPVRTHAHSNDPRGQCRWKSALSRVRR